MKKELKDYIKLLEKYTSKKVVLKEMPVDYTGTKSRMHPEIENKISKSQTDLSGNPALPHMNNEKFSNFEELLASKAFKRSAINFEKYTGLKIDPNNPMGMMLATAQCVQQLTEIEQDHFHELEQIANDLVFKIMGLEEGDLEFDLLLTGLGEIDLSDTDSASEEEIEQTTEELYEKYEELDLEIQKRRFINSLTQGAAVKAQDAFHLVKEEINRLDPRLLNLYCILCSASDAGYWTIPDSTIESLGGGEGASDIATGKMEVDPEGPNGIPLITVRAAMFPVLIHEMVKGVMEVYALHGQNEDQDIAKGAMQAADGLSKETWDLRLGPAIWETFREMYPDELFNEDKQHLEKYLLMKIYKIPAKEFNGIMRAILSKDPKGKKFMENLLKDIVEDLKKKHANEQLGEDDEEEPVS